MYQIYSQENSRSACGGRVAQRVLYREHYLSLAKDFMWHLSSSCKVLVMYPYLASGAETFVVSLREADFVSDCIQETFCNDLVSVQGSNRRRMGSGIDCTDKR
jgi:hypothetical protein